MKFRENIFVTSPRIAFGRRKEVVWERAEVAGGGGGGVGGGANMRQYTPKKP